MTEQFQFRLHGDLSSITGENTIVASSIGPGGEAVLLTVAPEFESAPFGREERKGFASFPFSKAKLHYPATCFRFDGREVLQRVELPQVEIAFPKIQPLPNGDVLLVGARCHYRDGDPEQNATVFCQSGNVQRQFVLGDGIQDAQTTLDGKIWVSFFDEGVFGNYGWDQPMGASGLICVDSAGHIEWEFKPPEDCDSICDCYAMNVAEEMVWACYYTAFPLVGVDSGRQVRAWSNEVRGASALAVDGRRALLWGGYGKKKRTSCVVQDIGEKSLVNSREVEISLPLGLELMGATVVGRGSILHAFAGTSWFTFDLRQLV
jgi:hypothetical protein